MMTFKPILMSENGNIGVCERAFLSLSLIPLFAFLCSVPIFHLLLFWGQHFSFTGQRR